jgi:hypothetical protein
VAASHRQEVEAILAGARAEHRALLASLSPAMRASLPVDATGIAQVIDHLGRAVSLPEATGEAQARGHRANPAVLHGRVFGRVPLSAGTVLAAFADGARVRAEWLVHLAGAVGDPALERDVRALVAAPAPESGTEATVGALRETYARQEEAALRIAARLDAAG